MEVQSSVTHEGVLLKEPPPCWVGARGGELGQEDEWGLQVLKRQKMNGGFRC